MLWVEFTVRVPLTVVVPVSKIDEGTVQVIGLTAFAGSEVTAQERSTSPAKLPEGATDKVAEPLVLPAAILIAEVRSLNVVIVAVMTVVPVEGK